jgi:hypothetical protein
MFVTVYGPADELTAIFYGVAVVLYLLAAFAAGTIGRRTGGAIGLVGLGLAFQLFPTMWNTFDVAF